MQAQRKPPTMVVPITRQNSSPFHTAMNASITLGNLTVPWEFSFLSLLSKMVFEALALPCYKSPATCQELWTHADIPALVRQLLPPNVSSCRVCGVLLVFGFWGGVFFCHVGKSSGTTGH